MVRETKTLSKLTKANFKRIYLPTGKVVSIPADIHLEFPDDQTLTPLQRCSLAFIPWDGSFIHYVPARYQELFRHALPYMRKRTTDVHTALSVAQLPDLFRSTDESVDYHIIYLAVILHDIGWSQVDLSGIATSLGYGGLQLSEAAFVPKLQHLEQGERLAGELLAAYDHHKHHGRLLANHEIRHITQIIRRHDQDAPFDQGKFDAISLETDIVCDADRLWSYTHYNFWQDTVRKNTEPTEYLVKLTGAVDSYFFTQQGRSRARQLLADRQREVENYLQALMNVLT